MTYLSVVLGLVLALFFAPGPRPEAARSSGQDTAQQNTGQKRHGFSDYAIAW
jgi:hypothetical protein